MAFLREIAEGSAKNKPLGEDVQELIDELVEEGGVEEVRLNEGKIRRWRKA